MSEKAVEIFKYTVLLSLITLSKAHSPCSSVYGAEPCTFLPAPPGKTPHCAQPGLTYCEHPEHYPGQRIQYLIQKWRFDFSTLLQDESREEFTSYFYPPPSYKYGPSNNIKADSYFPEPIYIPKPSYSYDPSRKPSNAYIPPSPYNHSQFTGYSDARPQVQLLTYKYSNNIPPVSGQPQEVYGPPPTYHNYNFNPYLNKIWKKEDKTSKPILIRKRREIIANNLRKLKSLAPNFNQTVLDRAKRQSAINGQTLCQTRSQFIMPRAALNNKGNWMYVVNMPEMDNRYTQLVKSETCASQTCSGLCSLPLGYTSRCEQKYVQKRLVALEGAGNELYSDVFWFPSCCVCTLSNS